MINLFVSVKLSLIIICLCSLAAARVVRKSKFRIFKAHNVFYVVNFALEKGSLKRKIVGVGLRTSNFRGYLFDLGYYEHLVGFEDGLEGLG